MKNNLPFSLLFILIIPLFFCCNTGNKSDASLKNKDVEQTQLILYLQQIDSLAKNEIIDTTLSNQFIDAAILYAKEHPEEKNAPEMLLNAALCAMNVARIATSDEEKALYANKALQLFNRIEKVYPDYEGIKFCYLYRGELYDSILHDMKSAEIEYRSFIHKFPNDSITPNLEAYINQLGKSPEQIMEEIKKNN